MAASTPKKNPARLRKEVKWLMDRDDVIGAVNELQNKFAASGRMLELSLPQIVVVGSQSSGKSSVLESLIGRECLPRGKGVVTRRPTIIQLYPSEESYAVFLHDESRKIHDFEQIKEEILQKTMEDPGPAGFSSNPINVKIYVPNVLKLTLVDLPGIVKVNIIGQSEESVETVNNMILTYIQQPNSIILAVTPAIQDIATSDSLQIAKLVDSQRERTIGVITKLDMMDGGTNACAVLNNSVLYLERGYVGVVNRNQMDIEEGRDIAYSLQKEKNFFNNHPAYCNMADRLGTPFLMRLLHTQLKEHIKKTLPALKKELSQKLNGYRKELKDFDGLWGSSSGEEGAQSYLLKALELFKDDIKIKLFGHSENMEMESLTAGAMINYKLYTDLQKVLNLPTALSEDKLIKLMLNQHGISNFLSVPPLTLEAACKAVLSSYKEPLEQIVDNIMETLTEAVESSASSVEIHPILKSAVMHFVSEAIDQSTEETKDLLGKHLKSQGAFCNVYHWDLQSQNIESGFPCSPVKLWEPHGNRVIATNTTSSTTESEENELTSAFGSEDNISQELISNKLLENDNAKTNSKSVLQVIQNYVKMLQKQVADVTIKYIVCFLIKGVFEFIKTTLTSKIFSSEEYNSLIVEFRKQIVRREEIVNMCSDIEAAMDGIQRF